MSHRDRWRCAGDTRAAAIEASFSVHSHVGRYGSAKTNAPPTLRRALFLIDSRFLLGHHGVDRGRVKLVCDGNRSLTQGDLAEVRAWGCGDRVYPLPGKLIALFNACLKRARISACLFSAASQRLRVSRKRFLRMLVRFTRAAFESLPLLAMTWHALRTEPTLMALLRTFQRKSRS